MQEVRDLAAEADALSVEEGVEDAEAAARGGDEEQLGEVLARVHMLWTIGGIRYARALLDQARDAVLEELHRVTSVVVLALLAAVPAMACFQQCQYSAGGDECVTKGWITNQSCYMSGTSCIEVPEYGCWAPKPEEEVAAWLAPVEVPVCEEGLTTAAE